MRPGFNWHTGKSDPSQIVDPKSQYVRAADKRLYRSSILTDQGARSRRKYGRNVMLPNQLNLRPDRPQAPILWLAPPGFDETKFHVSARLDALAAQYALCLQRTEADARRTANAAGDERSPSPASRNTMLAVPIVPEPRRSQRNPERRPVSYTQQGSESSSHDMPHRTSESSDSGSSASSNESSAGFESCFERSKSPEDGLQQPMRKRQMTESDRVLIMRLRSRLNLNDAASDGDIDDE